MGTYKYYFRIPNATDVRNKISHTNSNENFCFRTKIGSFFVIISKFPLGQFLAGESGELRRRPRRFFFFCVFKFSALGVITANRNSLVGIKWTVSAI